MFRKSSQVGGKAFLLSFVSILLMFYDHKTAALHSARAAISLPISAIEYVVSVPINYLNSFSQGVRLQNDLINENATLKESHLLLQVQLQRLLAIEAENNQLKALMHSTPQVQGKVLIAQLLKIDTDPFIHQMVLDKGSNDGVYVGQPVLDADGVMGKIIQVDPIASRVLVLNDSHSAIPVQNARNGLRGIAMGNSHTGLLHLANMAQTMDVEVGDKFVTSGLGELYPAGYPVGDVIAINRDAGSQFATIEIKPSAQPDRSRQLLLIWPSVNNSKLLQSEKK